MWQPTCPLLDAVGQGCAYAHRWKPWRKAIQENRSQGEKAGERAPFQNVCPAQTPTPPKAAATSPRGAISLNWGLHPWAPWNGFRVKPRARVYCHRMAIWGQTHQRASQKGLWVKRATTTSHYPALWCTTKSFTQVSHLGVSLPLLPTQAELAGPTSSPLTFTAYPELPINLLDLPMGFRCPLLSTCPLRAPKAAIYSCCAQPNCLWATSPSPYKDTVWPSAVHIGWPHLHVSSSLPQRQRWLHTRAVLLSALHARNHHPVRHKPPSEEPQPQEEGRDTRKPGELTWWSARHFCRVVNRSLCAFFGTLTFVCAL